MSVGSSRRGRRSHNAPIPQFIPPVGAGLPAIKVNGQSSMNQVSCTVR